MKTIPYSMDRIRNTETGEIGVVIYQSFGSDGVFYYVFWPSLGNAIKVKCLDRGTLSPEYEFVTRDYSKITENVMYYLQSVPLRRGILDTVARRLCSGYFEPERLVYFNIPGFIPWNKESFGPEFPFIILDIKKSRLREDRELDFTVLLCRYTQERFDITHRSFEEIRDEIMSGDSRGGVIEVPYSLEEYTDTDAYHILSRYDLEY